MQAGTRRRQLSASTHLSRCSVRRSNCLEAANLAARLRLASANQVEIRNNGPSKVSANVRHGCGGGVQSADVAGVAGVRPKTVARAICWFRGLAWRLACCWRSARPCCRKTSPRCRFARRCLYCPKRRSDRPTVNGFVRGRSGGMGMGLSREAYSLACRLAPKRSR
jgi:hypothetical protein